LLLELDGMQGLAGWQWLFLVEGVPAIVLGCVVLWYLTDSPEQAHWLSPPEREWLSGRIRAEHNAARARHGVGLWQALFHPTVWLLGLVIFACQAGSYGLTLWIPQIVQALSGLSDLEVSMISALPYAAAAVGMILIGRSSDRTGERFKHVAVPSFVAAVGFSMSAFLTSPVPAMIALTVAAVGDLGTRGPFWALPTRFLAGSAAAGGIALINTLGSLGGFVGPNAVGLAREVTGSFAGGLLFIAALLAAGAVLALRLRRATVFGADG
jgi:ACS family tartrate transporter-like MFS transporter